MKDTLRIVAISLVLVSDFIEGWSPLGFGGRGSYGLGSACEYDDDCVIAHSFCRHQEMCDCKRGFIPSEDGTQCLTLVGSFCESQYDCNSLEHSECRQETCQCEQRFVANKGGTQCLPKVASYQGECKLNPQCTSTMGEKSFCNQGRCECLPNHHFSTLEQRCFYNKGLFQMCMNNSECYLGDEYSTTFVECARGQCNCRYGYVVTEDKKCGSSSNVILLSPIFLFLTIFIINLDLSKVNLNLEIYY